MSGALFQITLIMELRLIEPYCVEHGQSLTENHVLAHQGFFSEVTQVTSIHILLVKASRMAALNFKTEGNAMVP